MDVRGAVQRWNWIQRQRDEIRRQEEALEIQLECVREVDPTRPATPADITVGNAILYWDIDCNAWFVKIVEEVLHPDDPYKAFCAHDGCRYGLWDAHVLVEGI